MTDFDAFSEQLEKIMLNEYDVFNLEKSPIAKALQRTGFDQLVYIIAQYTILPRELVHYMEWCRDKASEMHWNNIASELEDNIAEELGRGNDGISHYLMLVTGLEQGLGTNLQDTQPSLATTQMLNNLKGLFNHDPIYVLGTMYAVEKVSISELTLTLKVINFLLKNQLSEGLQRFFDMHLNVWEIEHEQDLRQSIAGYLNPSDYPIFEAGFRIILDIFDIWWRNLLIESILHHASPNNKSLLYVPTTASHSAVDNLESQKKRLGLSGSCYFDDGFLGNEKEHLFDKTWQFVGHESALSNPGDYFTVDFMGEQLIVIRTDENELKALHNVCSHRGAKILDGKGHCGNNIRCPYHFWVFDFKGHLKGMHRSQLFSTLDKSKAGLKSMHLDTWRGLIFIKLDGSDGEDLMTYLAGFPEHLGEYEYPWEELQEVDRWSYDEPVNWKFFVENYSESYHLTTVHAQSLGIFDSKKIEAGPTGLHHKIRMSYAGQDAVRDHQVFSGEPEHYSCQGIIFPNLMVNTAKDNVSFFKLIPLSPGVTRFEVIIYKTPQQEKELPYNKEEFRQEFDKVLQEDFTGVRRLQASVSSKAYSVHQYADDIEFGIINFHANLKKYLPSLKV